LQRVQLKSQDEGTIGMMQALVAEKERMQAEREELMDIFRSFKLDDVPLPSTRLV
jgi:hypothetical protein